MQSWNGFGDGKVKSILIIVGIIDGNSEIDAHALVLGNLICILAIARSTAADIF